MPSSPSSSCIMISLFDRPMTSGGSITLTKSLLRARRRAREDTTRGGMLQGLTAGLRLSRSALLGARVNRYGDEGRICARVAALDLQEFQRGGATDSAEKAVHGQDGTDSRRRIHLLRARVRETSLGLARLDGNDPRETCALE